MENNNLRFRQWDTPAGFASSALFQERLACGIYVLVFADGEEYVGQTVSFPTRFSAHRRRWGDITAVRFAEVLYADLNEAERAVIRHRTAAGVRLRNLTLLAQPLGSSPFDLVVDREVPSAWLYRECMVPRSVVVVAWLSLVFSGWVGATAPAHAAPVETAAPSPSPQTGTVSPHEQQSSPPPTPSAAEGAGWWGDLPGWIGGLGTVLGLGWAVFLYRESIRDKQTAQARLLSPLGPVTAQLLPAGGGMSVPGPGAAEGVEWKTDARGNLVFKHAVEAVTIRLQSASPEMFTDVVVWLVGTNPAATVRVPAGWSTVAPHASLEWTAYFTEGTLPGGTMDVRVRFTDAAGRHWQRSSREPLTRLVRRDVEAEAGGPPDDPIPSAYRKIGDGVRGLGNP